MCLCIYVCRTSKRNQKPKELKQDMRIYEYIQVFDNSITKRPTPPPATEFRCHHQQLMDI